MKVFSTFLDDEVADLLHAGKVGVLPTDTLYGIVACASNQEAVKKLYDIKNRDGKPGTIIAASVEQLEQFGIKRRYLKAVEQFWPNPLSIIIPMGDELAYLHCGKKSLALRIPDDQKLTGFLQKTGALVTSSANSPGNPPANNVQAAKRYFGDKVDFYVDGGDLSNRSPSTIIRVIDDEIEILRQGAVKIDENRRIQ